MGIRRRELALSSVVRRFLFWTAGPSGVGSNEAEPPPDNAYVAEDGTTYYVADDNVSYYVQES